MIQNINEKLFIAIQNYFIIHHQELVKPFFLVPRARKISKSSLSTHSSSVKILKSKNQYSKTKKSGQKLNALGKFEGLPLASNSQMTPCVVFKVTSLV